MLISNLLNSQGTFALRHYTKENGLPTNNINEIFQDKTGYIWIATGEGLCRYDGYTYKNYHYPTNEADYNVTFIEQDLNGRIWFATLKKEVYFIENDSIFPYKYNYILKNFKGIFHNFKINNIDSTLLFDMGRSGLIGISREGRINIMPENKECIAVIFEKDKILLSGFSEQKESTNTKTLKHQYIEWQKNEITKQCKIPFFNNEKMLHTFVCRYGSNGIIFILGQELIYFENQQFQWSITLPVIKAKPFVDSNGSIYLGLLQNHGLRKYENIFDLQNNIYTNLLPYSSITWINCDKDDGLWISTLDNGYFYIPNIHINVFTITDPNINGKLRAFTDGGNDKLALGFTSGELGTVDIKRGTITMLPKCPHPTSVYSIFYSKKHSKIFVATNILQYFEHGSWYKILQSKDVSLPCQHITYKNERILFCKTVQDGHIINQETGEIIPIKHGTENLNIRAYTQTLDSTIWISTKNEILNKPKNKAEFQSPNLSNSLFNKPAEYMFATKDGCIIIGNKKNLYYLFKNKIARIQPKISGFPGDDAKITESKNGRIWIASSRGCMVYKFHDDKYDEQYIGFAHGLPDPQIFDILFLKDKIWLLSNEILMTIPDTIYHNGLITPILEKFIINDSEINFKQHEVFPYNKNSITIALNTFNYRLSNQGVFRYRLDTNSPWQETSQKEIKLFSLVDKTYKLEIQAQNEEKEWGPTLELNFSIAPIFFKSWWFILCASLLFLSISYNVYRYHISNIRKEADAKALIAELERSALQAQMNPHFIFNCLTSIQNFILKNDKMQASQYLSKFASLVRDTLNASVNKTINIEDEVRMLECYLSLEQLRFNHNFEFSILVGSEIDQFDSKIPPMLIQPFVENAVKHGTTSSLEKGKILVTFNEKDGFLIVEIIDNGNGFVQNEIKQQKIVSYKSLGIDITTKRLNIYRGKYYTLDPVLISAMYDDEGIICGTRVVLNIPF